MRPDLADLKLSSFLDTLASDQPAPGGGSAAALVVAMAAALVEMVARLTLGRERFAGVEEDLRAVAEAAPALRRELAGLVDRDTKAFEGVMAARRLPSATEDDKTRRREALQKAAREATLVPLRVTELACEVLALARLVAEKGNPRAITDAGVSGFLGLAGAEGAGLNVRINLPDIADEVFRRKTEDEVSRYVALAHRTASEVAASVKRRMVSG